MAIVPTIIKISNVLAYVFLLSANIYSVAGPVKEDSPWTDNHKTFITPAPFAFWIWGLIHTLFFGFIIYQWFSSASETVVDGVGWHFVGISVLNTIWVLLWQNDHLIWSWIVILITASQVSFVYYSIKNKYPSTGFADALWIHAPISLYHAWILVIVVINTFAAFTAEAGENEKPTLITNILVFLGLLFLESTAVGYIELGKGDAAGALVIAWTLFAIFAEQKSKFIHWSALVFAVLTLFHSVKPLVKKYFFNSHAENAPLLG
ncbi:hypothetical protein G9A89_021104 [Geosiphon pyriformis]|nr:hypothetical protein G9A89_021104 [Geosiphon pyriformis]